MPLLGLLVFATQIFFAVHAVRNGKDTFWLWVIIFAPGIGCLVYFFTQFAPEMANNRSVRRAAHRLARAVDPQRELRKRKEMLAIADTVDNRLGLADECMEARLFGDAIELLREALVGVHRHDPGIMERLARAHFENGQPAQAVETLDALKAANPDYRSTAAHLLYARALEAQDRIEDAKLEYDVLRASFPGEEARVRYALMLQQRGETGKAMDLFQESLLRARRAPQHYRAKEREWLLIAERAVAAAAGRR